MFYFKIRSMFQYSAFEVLKVNSCVPVCNILLFIIHITAFVICVHTKRHRNYTLSLNTFTIRHSATVLNR